MNRDYLSILSISLIMTMLVLVFFLNGCSKQPEYKVIYKTKLILEKPPKALLERDITVPMPPNTITYVNAMPIQRENILTLYIVDLLKTIKEQKEYRKSLIEWYKKSEQNFKQLNTTDGSPHQ